MSMGIGRTRVGILDHGYVGLVGTWGSDQELVEAARMSTGRGFLGWDPGPCPVCMTQTPTRLEDFSSTPMIEPDPGCIACEGSGQIRGDQKLLEYLYNSKPQHATPFEMGGMVIEVQAPIFVFREWHRHRTQSYNEMSARYTPLPDLNYIPSVERLMVNASGSNKQANRMKG